jgi:hypothetical protein
MSLMNSGTWDIVGYYFQFLLAMWCLYVASGKPLDAAVIWLGCGIIIMIRAEGKRIRQEVGNAKS